MSKVFKLFFVIILFFLLNLKVFASSGDLKIISRQQWGANLDYMYLDSSSWQELLEKWKKLPKKKLTQEQKQKAKLEAQKVKKANEFLLKNFGEIIGIKKVIKYKDGHRLAWPIAYSKKKIGIVIHHTDSDVSPGDDNYKAIREIYKYHAIVRGWGDIGYNYLIGTNGEIFEGRAGGDYVVGAHDKWNNQSTIGIALIGNYSQKKAPEKQIQALKKLIKYLIKKYNIDVNKKQAFFSWCVGTSKKCIENPLIINYKYPIIGHRDAGHTACPGDALYYQIQELKKELGVGAHDKINKKLNIIKEKLKKFNEHSLLKILVKIELALDNVGDSYKKLNQKIILLDLKKYIFDLVKYNKNIKNDTNVSFDKSNKIKVKLSYPLSNYISFKISKNSSIKLERNKKEYILNVNSGEKKRDLELKFYFKNNKLFAGNREIVNFNYTNFFRIHNLNPYGVIEISSWNRKPIWDKSGFLNDNKFRGDIVLYSKNNKLIVVNELFLNDYLKGIGEVSNSTNFEKIKTIIVLARTYARWYITKARKFAGEWFDASDDPNIFQKYLGYGLEKRSPNIVKAVEQTQDLVVTYDGNLIKPWYFSSSNGKTISFIDYCKKAKGVPDCAHPEKFPFLVGVEDPGGIGKIKAGHGVGVPGTGVEYLSQKGWDFSMIIKYFLKGVGIEKK